MKTFCEKQLYFITLIIPKYKKKNISFIYGLNQNNNCHEHQIQINISHEIDTGLQVTQYIHISINEIECGSVFFKKIN